MAKRDKGREKARQKARENARRQAKRSRTRGSGTISIPDGVEFFKPIEDGSQTIAILSFTAGKNRALLSDVDPGDPYYKVAFKQHRGVGPEDKVVVCPKSFGANKACPICEEYAAARQSEAEYDDYKELRAKDRDIFLVAYKDKLHLMEMPWFWLGKLLDNELEEDDGDGCFFFPEDGIDVRVTWETDTYGTKAVAVRFRGRKDDIDDGLIETAIEMDLAECVVETSYDDLYALFHGQDADEDEDGDKDKSDAGDEPEDSDADTGDDDDDLEKKIEAMEENAEDLDIDISGKLLRKAKKGDEDALEEIEDLIADAEKAAKKDKKKEDKKDKGKKDSDDDGECPEGHTYGIDNDNHDDCDNCKVFEECEEAKPKKKK